MRRGGQKTQAEGWTSSDKADFQEETQTPHFNTISKSTVLGTDLSEFFGPHQALQRELSELLSASDLFSKAQALLKG